MNRFPLSLILTLCLCIPCTAAEPAASAENSQYFHQYEARNIADISPRFIDAPDALTSATKSKKKKKSKKPESDKYTNSYV